MCQNIRHPIKLLRFYRRALLMRDNDPGVFRRVYAPKLCWIGRLILRHL